MNTHADEEGAARVLVADDNADLREYVKSQLAPPYAVETVADGEAALAAARRRPPDLVLSGVTLPRLGGVGLLRELRADPRTQCIPVILLSERAGEESTVEGRSEGADDYLLKPFSACELRARVRTHLDLARRRREWIEELEHANRELEAFSYSVSHDLRAPLHAIRGFIELMREEYSADLGATGQDYLTHMAAGAERMAELIEDLLDLSRVTRAPLMREPVDLSALARRVVDEMVLREPGRQVAVEIPAGMTGDADPGLLRIVLQNLIGNAWKFTSKTPEASIFLGQEDRAGERVTWVRDNGAGFNPQHADQLFTPFRRLHSATEFEGSGIGLATVRRIIARHRGRVWAEAVVNGGATFFFTLGSAR